MQEGGVCYRALCAIQDAARPNSPVLQRYFNAEYLGARCRRITEARAMFERLLALRNDVGLLAEEYDPRGQRQMGNFPQAFSHVALVNTAYNLTRCEGPTEERAGREATEDYRNSAAAAASSL